MTRPRGAHALLAAVLAVMLATLAIAQPTAAMAQATGQMQSQTVGSATVNYGPTWQYNADISDATSIFLSNTSLQGTIFIHGEIADATVTDPASGLEQFATGFFGEFGDKDDTLVDSGTMSSDPSTAWHLYSVSQSGIPYGALITGNTTVVPGTFVTNMLLAPVGSFPDAVQSVKDEIDINGAGSPFAQFDGAQLEAALEGGTTTATTPVTGTTPAAGTTPAGGLTLPPIGGQTAAGTETPVTGTETPATGTTPAGGLTLPPIGGQTTTGTETPATGTETPATGMTPAAGTTAGQGSTVVVNGVTVAYGAPWTYGESLSTPDQIAFFTHGTDQTTLFAYARTPSSSTDAQGSLTQFNTGFFNSFGATNVQQVTMETLPSGHAWSLNTGDKDGTPIALLALADVTTDPADFRVQIVLAPVSAFPAALPDAQSAITVDGQPALGELDSATVLSLLGVGASATTGTNGGPTQVATETTTTTTATAAPQGAAFSVTGDVSQYEAQDTQGTCDAIGWAATASNQIPSTEQDINYRSSCVGGGSFFAACGTAAPTDLGTPEAGMVWIQCDVTVRVDGAPMTLSMFDFELSDSTGAVYTFDIMAALASIMNVEVFPEEPVQTGQSATGSVLFSVPETAGASGPWLLSVKPETLATSGGQPGTIVIAGDLQPFSAPAQ
jgi:hypothetical protein